MIEALAAGMRRIYPRKIEALLYVGECLPLDSVSGIPVVIADGLFYGETGTSNEVNYIPIGKEIRQLDRVRFAQEVDDKGGAK
ncbi:MAG: hypothetical protein ACEQSB_06385 [Undibacterium sp.]